MGTSTAAARIGSFCAPYVTYLYRYHPLIPYGIIAVNCLLASLACLTLPETAHKPTAETLDKENIKDDAGKLLETTSI